jgi:hypothetical protein
LWSFVRCMQCGHACQAIRACTALEARVTTEAVGPFQRELRDELAGARRKYYRVNRRLSPHTGDDVDVRVRL